MANIFLSPMQPLVPTSCLYLRMDIFMETPVDQTEWILITKCLDGNPKAQQELYHRYARAMYNTCLRMCQHTADAEDALQESFVYVFRHLDSFRKESTLGAWIKRIVINHCINRLRSRRMQWDELDEPTMADVPDDHPEPEPDQWKVQAVKSAIDRLSEGYRTVLHLYLMEGYDHGEIASILQISEATSKSQYSRARQRVRELLANPDTHVH